MKITLLTCLCSAGLLISAYGQDPLASPPAPPAAPPTAPPLEAAASPAATVRATATPADDEDDEGSLERRIERKVKRGLNITINGDDGKRRRVDDFDIEEGAGMAIGIIGIIFTTLLGAPVLIVAVIMFFSYIKARSLHKTVRMMVEKGQPVPEALFAAPHTPARVRSDVRRGVVLVMIGIGVMLFLAAVNEFEGGAWGLGLIPFMIGAGYLVLWYLEGNKITFNKGTTDNAGTDTPPPLP